MALPITRNTRYSLQKIKKEPAIVLDIDGVGTLIGSSIIYEYITIGMPDLEIGNEWRIGGKIRVSDQIDGITFSSSIGSTTTTIDYKVDPDKGRGESVTSLTISLLDTKSLQILQLFSYQEMLGRRVKVLISPDSTDTSFPEDYVTVFRGIIESCDYPAGGITVILSHPDQKKRQTIYPKGEGELFSSISDSDTNLLLKSGEGLKFIERVQGPDGSYDPTFQSYVRIDDEIIGYTGISTDTLTGLTRGQFGTVAASHDGDAEVVSIYRLQGNVIDVALKLMLSGWGTNFSDFVTVKAFNYVNNAGTEIVPNAVFFSGVDVTEEYGLVAGDYISTQSSDHAENTESDKVIQSISVTDQGSYVVVNGVSFVNELAPDLTLSMYARFRSKYDTLPVGLKMYPDEVDVAEHERIRTNFLSASSVDIRLQETIENAKEFIEKQLYTPISLYSTPRRAKSSVAYMVGPLPNTTIVTLNQRNVKNADKLVKKRGMGKNFYNTIIYRYDDYILDPARFLKGIVQTDATSLSRIPVGIRALTIDAPGWRNEAELTNAADKRLDRYAFAAEYFDSVTVLFADGYAIEPSDLVILDGVNLQIADKDAGTRSDAAKFYEVIGKRINLQTGDISLALLDTNLAVGANRYALISPASYVKIGTSASSFQIESSFASILGPDEFQKWNEFGKITVRLRTIDYVIEATGVIDHFSGNTVFLQNNLPFTPSAGMLMELSDYNDATEEIKLLYGFISNGTANFDDGKKYYGMI